MVTDVTSSKSRDLGGARFVDAAKRDRGCANLVTMRGEALSGLTVLEVFGADPQAAQFLARLDRSRLVIQDPSTGSALFKFRWASGYENGKDLRVQGQLEPA
jgi:hypothetical protein